jgi:hypothetical protein
MHRTPLIPLILLSSAAVAAVPAARAGRPAPGAAVSAPQLIADRAVVQPGATLTLQGRGFPRDAHIALLARQLHGERMRIGGARTGSRGSFTATIHIRPGSAAGRVVAFACHDACRVKASADFRIAAR